MKNERIPLEIIWAHRKGLLFEPGEVAGVETRCVHHGK